MNVRRLVFAGLVLVALGLVGSLCLVNYWQASQPTFKDTGKLMAALNNYTRDMAQRQQAIPKTVTLDELVRAGYIDQTDVHAFEGIKLTFYPGGTPEGIIIRAQMPAGDEVFLMANGSVRSPSAGHR